MLREELVGDASDVRRSPPASREERVTLLTATRDVEHSGASVLAGEPRCLDADDRAGPGAHRERVAREEHRADRHADVDDGLERPESTGARVEHGPVAARVLVGDLGRCVASRQGELLSGGQGRGVSRGPGAGTGHEGLPDVGDPE